MAKEFPTAPTDSFVVANAAYVARATGSDAVGTFLVQTDGSGPRAVAAPRARRGRHRPRRSPTSRTRAASSARTSPPSSCRASPASSSRSRSLLAVAASGLALALGFRERRRTFAIAVALGRAAQQLGGFVWGESAFVTAGGLGLGAVVAARRSR